jgi:AraC-like DNA-binding protein
MDLKIARKKLIEYLSAAVDIQMREVIFAFSKPEPKVPFSKHPHFRLSLVLDGSDKMIISKDGKIEQIEIVPGQVIFFLYNGWALPVFPSVEGFHLSLVFYEDFMRIVGGIGKPGEFSEKYWYHTDQSICRLGIHVIQALNSLAIGPDREERGLLLVRTLLLTALEDLKNDHSGDSGKARQTYHLVKDYLYTNYHIPINRESVAKDLRIHESYISKLFKSYSNESFNAFLKRLRMEHAARLLAESRNTVDEISLSCGFISTTYFIKAFKTFYGVSPGRFRQAAIGSGK